MREGEVEFDCIDCGDAVIMFGTDTVPDPARCAVCTWIVGVGLPIEQQAELRERLGHPLKQPPVDGRFSGCNSG